MGTSQQVISMHRHHQYEQWRVWVNVCWLIMALVLMLSIPVEALGLGIGGTNIQRLTETPVSNSYRLQMGSGRANSSMVGTIMALLATFDEAGILPSEGTAQANQVIHGLIQLQSALMKSPSSALATYRMAAVAHWKSQHKEEAVGAVGEQGLSARMLAALIGYDQEHPLWDDHDIESAMQAFKVTHEDWRLIVELFRKAEAVFHRQGRSMHTVYEGWRKKMPGRE